MEMTRLKGPNYRAVKLRHPTLRNATYTVQQQSRIYPSPYPCNDCGRTHIFKTYHLRLNQHGEVTVSEEIYEMFKAEGMLPPLEAAKETTPAPTSLNMGVAGGPFQIANPVVYSREEGLIAVPVTPYTIWNAVLPPAETHRRAPDGTWILIERGGQ